MPDFSRGRGRDTSRRGPSHPLPSRSPRRVRWCLGGSEPATCGRGCTCGCARCCRSHRACRQCRAGCIPGEEEGHVSLAHGQEVFACNLLHVLATRLARNDLVEISSSRQCSITHASSTWRNTSHASKTGASLSAAKGRRRLWTSLSAQSSANQKQDSCRYSQSASSAA